MTQQQPPGWYAQPDGTQRYWDGQQWTNHVAPAPSPLPRAANAAPAPGLGAPSGEPAKPWFKKKRVVIPAVALVAIVGLASTQGGSGQTAAPQASPTLAAPALTDPTESPTEEPTQQPSEAEQEPSEQPSEEPAEEPKSELPSVPSDQAKFLELVAEGSDSYDEAKTDLQRNNALAKRNKAICKALPKGSFKNWVGTIKDVGSDSFGDPEEAGAYLEVSIADDVTIGTWNNSLSDLFDETLVAPNSPLYDVLLGLSPGDTVKVSGRLTGGDNSCGVKTKNLTDTFNAASPEFLVKFSKVSVGN